MDIYIGHDVEKATIGLPGRCSAYRLEDLIGRARSIAFNWRVPMLQPYNIKEMDEESMFDN